MGAGQAVSAFHPQDASDNKKKGLHSVISSAVEGAAPVTTQDPFILGMGDP